MKKKILILLSVFTGVLVFGDNTKQEEDKVKRINLARTSLALVSASSCNGDRPLSNNYYGILNAFDGGSNWVNKINYSYWMPNCNQGEWLEVEFSCPVSIHSLILEGSSQCDATLSFENGEQKVFGKIIEIVEPIKINDGGMISSRSVYAYNQPDFLPTTNSRTLKFEEVMNGVKKVTLTFTGNNSRLSELKILGPIPDGKKYKVGKPRLKVTKKDSLLAANDVYRIWLEKTYGIKAVETELKETEKCFIYIYKKDDKILLKVVVNKKDGIGKIDSGENKIIKSIEQEVKPKSIYSYDAIIWKSGEQEKLTAGWNSPKGGIFSNYLGEPVSITIEGKKPEKSEVVGAISVSGKKNSKCILPIRKWEEKGKTVYSICEPNANVPYSVISVSSDEKVITYKTLGILIDKLMIDSK